MITFMAKRQSGHLSFFGATGTVTGSKFLYTTSGSHVLVDCGLFQGFKQLRLRNWTSPPFSVRDLDAIVLTHAHIDHSGYLPLLVKRGFDGPILCTPGTLELCKILLPDSGRLHEADADYANRKRLSKHDPALPLYTEDDAHNALKQFVPVDDEGNFEVTKNVRGRFSQAGHIIGARSVLLESRNLRVFFSGDVGRPHDALMHAPAPPPPADYFVVESTYGNRKHPPDDAEARVAEILRRCITRKGIVLVPAFAVGRTQALLLLLTRLFESGAVPRIPVFLDSPMAISATHIYSRFADEHRLSTDEASRMFNLPKYVRAVEGSKSLDRMDGPMVLISASGMATGGRVVHHLKCFAANPDNTIMFTGFQAGGTRGAKIVGGAATVRIHREDIPIAAEVQNLNHLSAHADCDELVTWLRAAPARPKTCFLVHGDPEAADTLRSRLEAELDWSCTVPEFRERFDLIG
jgi:metallo-beta-lactamase family protein